MKLTTCTVHAVMCVNITPWNQYQIIYMKTLVLGVALIHMYTIVYLTHFILFNKRNNIFISCWICLKWCVLGNWLLNFEGKYIDKITFILCFKVHFSLTLIIFVVSSDRVSNVTLCNLVLVHYMRLILIDWSWN